MANLVGTGAGELLAGSVDADFIQGLGGNDDLRGGGGGDRLEGGIGDDQLDGEAGNDTIYGGAGNDGIVGGASGNDAFFGEAGDDFVFISRNGQASDRLIVYSGEGNDRVQVQLYGGGTVDVAGGAGNDEISIIGGARYVYGEAGQDTFALHSLFNLSAFVIADFTTGDAGDRLELKDYLSKLTNWDGTTNPFSTGHLRLVQSGTSTLFQADLNGGGDSYFTQITLQNTNAESFTTFNLGIPKDGSALAPKTITGTASGEILQGGFETNLIQGLGGNDDLRGGGGGDRLEGGIGDDQLDGEAGNDTIYGGAGNDGIVGGASGNDAFFGEAGDDFVFISRNGQASDRLIVYSGEGNDRVQVQLYGGGTVDVAGGAGNDEISIIGGARYVYGEAGQDTFALHSLFNLSAFVIADFTTGDAGDRLELKDYLPKLTNWDGTTNPFSTGHLRLVQSGTSTLFQADLNGGGDSYFTQITLQNANAGSFTASNIGGISPAPPPPFYAANQQNERDYEAGYQAGADFVVELSGHAGTLTLDDFI